MNWKARLSNKVWLVSVASAVILAAQTILPLCGMQFDGGKAMDIVNVVLGVFVALGIVVDPTTPGIKDGE